MCPTIRLSMPPPIEAADPSGGRLRLCRHGRCDPPEVVTVGTAHNRAPLDARPSVANRDARLRLEPLAVGRVSPDPSERRGGALTSRSRTRSCAAPYAREDPFESGRLVMT